MTPHRLLLCTDMDRTIIPNGSQSENPSAREQFRLLCDLPAVSLVYVTGRHLQLVLEAIADFHLPRADFVISDVGTKMYQQRVNYYQELGSWQDLIARDWQGKSHAQLQQALVGLPQLTLQQRSKQNSYKLSYYLPVYGERPEILLQVEDKLRQLGVAVSLVYSVDENKQQGLLDILPCNANKLHAIKYLQQQLGYRSEEVVFAGDSGNDLEVLASSIRSIVVANATPMIKEQALELAARNNTGDSLFIARQKGSPLGGNYSAGVLQGVNFYAPEIGKDLLRK